MTQSGQQPGDNQRLGLCLPRFFFVADVRFFFLALGFFGRRQAFSYNSILMGSRFPAFDMLTRPNLSVLVRRLGPTRRRMPLSPTLGNLGPRLDPCCRGCPIVHRTARRAICRNRHVWQRAKNYHAAIDSRRNRVACIWAPRENRRHIRT